MSSENGTNLFSHKESGYLSEIDMDHLVLAKGKGQHISVDFPFFLVNNPDILLYCSVFSSLFVGNLFP